MKKRFITILIAFVLCFSSVFALSGCGLSAREFTVTFVPGVGFESAQVQGETVQTVKNANELVPPTFIFDGWWHDGWNDVVQNIKSDTTLTARWVKRKIQVTFTPGAADAHLEDKLPSENNQVVVEVGSGAELAQKAPNYIREGYTVSWEHLKDYTDIQDKATIAAVWIANEYTIKFVNSDGTPTTLADKTVTFNEKVGDLPTLEVQNGKNFAGWQITTSGGNNELISEESVWRYPYNAELKALWLNPNEYSITYIDAYTHSNMRSYNSAEGYTLLPPTRNGYQFIGWSGTGIDGMAMQVTIAPGETGDKTYTANWQAEKYNLSFNANGGSVGKDNMQVEFGKAVGELPVAQKEGYEFTGWTTQNGTVITADTVWLQTSSITVTAQYKRVITIKLVLDCTVRGEKVTCTIPNSYISEYELTKVDGENAYIMSGYKEGDTLPRLPIPKTSDEEEYKFSNWKYNSEKKNPGTVIDEKNFPGVINSGVITLKVSCYALWTPFY